MCAENKKIPIVAPSGGKEKLNDGAQLQPFAYNSGTKMI